MARRVVVDPSVAAEVRRLPPDVKRSVRAALEAIAHAPTLRKELLRELAGLRSYKVRRYGVVYAVASRTREIRVVAVGLRTSVYEDLARARATK
jgi:mRNA interferase RelE/StbE